MVNDVFTRVVARLIDMAPRLLTAPLLCAPAFAAAVAALALTAPARAEAPLKITPSAAAQPDERAAREQQLEKLRADQQRAKDNEAKFAAEIAAIGQDRQRLTKALIEAAARLREVEERIAASESRLKALDENESSARASLERRKAATAGLLAALQRMGHRPPPVLLVQPETALDAVRAAIMLGAVLPEMRAEVETLAADLGDLVRVRRDIAAERETLSSERARLSAERARVTALMEERQKRQAEVEKALEAERRRTAALVRQAQDLKDLLARLTADGADARHGGGAALRPPAGETPRLGPAIAFADAKGTLRLPVHGVTLRQFGSRDASGDVQKGISVATRASAQVTAPCDAWVVYAGPFRSYGQLLILNAGGGYHVLIAGMERISVDLGQFVLTGEPVAMMGGGPRTAAAIATDSRQPILYIEFRKDGTPVDPGPWWTKTDSEKVRG